MMKYKAAIFDLDGVIVDTARFHYLAWKELADDLGFAFTLTDNERLKGVSRQRSLEILLDIGNIQLSEKDQAALAQRKNTRYIEMLDTLTQADILPGSADILHALRCRGVKAALGSASKNAPYILEKLALYDAFDVVIDGNKTSKAKPDPEVFLLGSEALGVPENACVVFEDAPAGIEAARAGGMFSVGVGKKALLYSADIVLPDLRNWEQVMKLF
jgi:beta-phosphoglucomutase